MRKNYLMFRTIMELVLHKSKLISIRLNADSFFYQAEALVKLNKNQN